MERELCTVSPLLEHDGSSIPHTFIGCLNMYMYILIFVPSLESHALVYLAFSYFQIEIFAGSCLTDFMTLCFNFKCRYFQGIPEAAVPENEQRSGCAC